MFLSKSRISLTVISAFSIFNFSAGSLFGVETNTKQAYDSSVQNKKTSIQLESLIVDVNGERRRIEPTKGFSAVRGDLITIVEAFGSPMNNFPVVVEIDGYRAQSKDGRRNDLRKVVDTSVDLNPLATSRARTSRHRVRVLVGGKVIGSTFMDIVEPELISLEVEVNNVTMSLRSGDRLTLGPHDGVKVIDVRTNVRGNENVKHDLISKSLSNGRSSKEIRFTRGSTIFARIPIDWKGS